MRARWLLGLALLAALAWAGSACSSDDEGGGEGAARSPGAQIYARHCAACHGAQGGGGQGPALTAGPAADLSDTEMAQIVTQGRRAMPAFGGRLSDTQIEQVVDFVRTELGREPGDGAGDPGDDGDGDRGSLRGVPPEVRDAAGDWPLANGDYSSHRAVHSPRITSDNVDQLEEVWTYEVPGGGRFGNLTTTPIISGGTVFVGALDTKVHAIDRETGEERFVAGEETGIFGPTGVAVGWGRVYGTTSREDGKGAALVAYDAETGEEVWTTDLGGNGGDLNVQPVAYGGLVFASTSGYGAGTRATIYAVDAETGTIVWDFPVVEDEDLWGHPEINSGGGVWYPATIDPERGLAYFGTGNPYPFPGAEGFPNGASRPGDNRWTDSILALDVETGELAWGWQAIPHDIFDRDAMLTARVDVEVDGEEQELAISTGKLGIVTALDAETGDVVWRRSVGTHENDELTEIDGPTLVYPGSLGGVQTPLAIADGTIYVCVMNAPTEYAGPEETSYGFTVKLGTANSQLVAIDAATGEVQWDVELDGDALGGATVSGDLVFTSTFGGSVTAHDRETGDELWSYQAPGGINGWPAIAGDELYIPVGIADPPRLVKLKLPS